MEIKLMKNLIIYLFFALLGFSCCPNKCYGQIDSSIYNRLSPEAKKEISNALQSQKITNQLNDYVSWSGKGEEIGRAVGSAVNGALSAITDNAEKFANTKVGHFTMFIVAYKVLGKDFIRIIIGIPFLILILIFTLSYMYRNFFPKKVISKITGEGKDKIKEYIISPDFTKFNNTDQSQFWLHLFLSFMFTFISCLAIIAFFIP